MVETNKTSEADNLEVGEEELENDWDPEEFCSAFAAGLFKVSALYRSGEMDHKEATECFPDHLRHCI